MTPADIVRVARSKVGSHDWLYDTKKDNFAEKTHKCNQFIYDVLVEAGCTPLPQVPKWHGVGNRAPTAGEWATTTTVIPGWTVVSTAEPGDIVAEAANYSDATGHVGFVVGPNSTVSAAALPPKSGTVVENDWGFRSDSKPTFRRCTLFVTGKKP